MTILRIALLFLLAVMSAAVAAQLPNPYGLSINAETAKKVAAAAIAQARQSGLTMAVAVTDTNGDLVYFEKMDKTQLGSVDVSLDKARSATRFKRSTKLFQDALAAGGVGLRILRLRGAIPVEGGLPLLADGKPDGDIIGAIGCSGGKSEEDGQVCQAGANALIAK